MIIALTGHREQRLGLSSDVSLSEWKPIRNWIREQILQQLTKGQVEFMSGMASGSDRAAAYEVCKLKEEGFPITLTCVFPCKNYNTSDINNNYIRQNADNIIELHEAFFKGCDNDRDQYMAEHCDIMLAIFDGNKNSGVWSTIKKATRNNKTVIYYPFDN